MLSPKMNFIEVEVSLAELNARREAPRAGGAP